METQPTEQTDWAQRWLWIIILIAILVRVPAAFYLGDHVVPMPATYDQVSYDRLARSVLAGKGFTFDQLWWPHTPAHSPTAHWSFLYTLYLAGVYWLFGHHPLVARLIQGVASGCLISLLIYRLGRRVFGNWVGLVGAGLAAVYIYFVYYGVCLLTEPFYIAAVLFTLDSAQELVDRPSFGRWALLGLALGLAALLRQVILFFVPVLFAWLLWTGRERVRLRDFVIPLAIIAALIAPWTVRNYLAFHRFVLLNTNAGYAFFWANHPAHGTDFVGVFREEGKYQAMIPEELRELNEAQLNDALLREGLRFVIEDPWRYLLLSLSRVKLYFIFWPVSRSSSISNLSRVLSFGLYLPFMIYGLAISLRRWRRCLLLYLFVGLYTLIHLLSWSLMRYRLPVDAVLIAFAALALVDIVARIFRRYDWTIMGKRLDAVYHMLEGDHKARSR